MPTWPFLVRYSFVPSSERSPVHGLVPLERRRKDQQPVTRFSHTDADVNAFSFFRVPDWFNAFRRDPTTTRVGTVMLWVGQTLLLSVVCLGHAAENVLLGSPEGRMYLVPRDVVTGAVKERPPWDVCLHSFGSLMPFVSWALTRNEFRVNGAMATFWPAGGQPRWGELIDSLRDKDRHFRCGTCCSDRTVSENRFRRMVAEKGLPLSCHMVGEQCSAVKRSAPRTASVGEPFNSQRANYRC